MIINVRQGFPFSIDMYVEFGGGPLGIAGSAAKWVTADGLFNPVCTTIAASLGRARFYASPEQTKTWPLGIMPAVLVFRGPTNLVHELKVRVKVHPRDSIIPLPDNKDHRGYQGGIVDQGHVFDFEGTKDETGGGGGSDPAFYRVDVGGQPPIEAPGPLSVLVMEQGPGIAITTDPSLATVKVSNTGVTSVNGNAGAVNTPNCFSTVIANGGLPVVADSTTDTLYVTTPGAGLSAVGVPGTDTLVLTNTGVTSVAAGPGIALSAATGPVTISSTAAVTDIRVLASDFLTTSGVPPAVWSIVVPAGKKVHLRAEVVLYTGGSTTLKAVWGFRYNQLGTADPEGPQLSYGSYNLRAHKTDATSGYTSEQHVGSTLSFPVGVLRYSTILSPSILVSGYGVGEIFIKNGGSTDVVLAVVAGPETAGNPVTVFRGSSFIATIT